MQAVRTFLQCCLLGAGAQTLRLIASDFHGALPQASTFPGNPAQNGQGECFLLNNKHKPLTGKNSGLKDPFHCIRYNGGDVVPGREVNVLEVQDTALAK